MNSVVRTLPPTSVVDADEFRGAMRHLAGGVSIITGGRGRDISGMTVTSATSLTVEPPTLIVAINRAASTLPLLRRYGAFGVNVLAGDQREVAERFTGKGGHTRAERFAGSSWIAGPAGVPLLKGSLAAIGCEVEEIIERHSHAIVLGHVVSVVASEASSALIYWRGQYVVVDPGDDASRGEDASLPTPRALWD